MLIQINDIENNEISSESVERIIFKENYEMRKDINDFLLHQKLLENKNYKGILKRKSYDDIDDQTEKIIKIIVCVMVLLICSPICVFDLYYGYTDKSCVNETMVDLNLNMRTYLLVSGYTGLIILAIIISTFYCISRKITIEYSLAQSVCIKVLRIMITIFNVSWTVVGSIIFWGSLYNERICDKNISTYLFASLILKCLGVIHSITVI